MNATEKRLAAMLLEMASDHYGNHGCNDWEWPEWVTPAERKRIAHDMEMQNSGDPEEAKQTIRMYGGKYGPPDWWIMAYIGKLLASEVEGS